MGAVEDPGSAGGGGERRAGEGTERLERGREEGGKEPFEPSVPGLGRALGGDPRRAEGGGLWAGPPGIGVEGYSLDSGSPGIRTEFALLKLGLPLAERSFTEPKSLGEKDPRAASDWRNRAGGFFPLGSSLGDLVGGGSRRRVGILLQSPWPLAGSG